MIAATWNEQRHPSDPQERQANAKFLADVEGKLRDQAKSLAERVKKRQLIGTNEEFKNLTKDVDEAVKYLDESTQKLQGEQVPGSDFVRAESVAVFARVWKRRRATSKWPSDRKVEAGAVERRGISTICSISKWIPRRISTRLASARPSEKQRQEDRRTCAEARAACASRQQELAQQQQQKQGQTFQQKWQQELLRREAEELQKQLQQMMQQQQGSSSNRSRANRDSKGQQGQQEPVLEFARRPAG